MDPSTETQEHPDEEVSTLPSRAQRTQANTLEAIANLLRRDGGTPVELSAALIELAEKSVAENPDADIASGMWMDAITAYSATSLLALAGWRSRSALPVRVGVPPPLPPPILAVDGVTHSVEGGAISVILHCAQDHPPVRRNFCLDVFVDAATLQRCATLPDPQNEFRAYLAC